MATFDDVARLARDLPEVTRGRAHGHRTWLVGGKGFAWERPFSKADIKRFGDEPRPAGPILAVRVEDLGEKEAVLAAQPRRLLHDPALRRLRRGADPAAGRSPPGAARRDHRRLAGLRPAEARAGLPQRPLKA